MSFIAITTTSDDKSELQLISKMLVEQRLAACCQIIGPINSIYRWNDSIEDSQEWMCLIKTRELHFSAVEKIIVENHHYDLPEIIGSTLSHGNRSYLEWIDANIH